MAETVTVTPQRKLDTKGNPIGPPPTPVELTPLEVAPGNTLLSYGVGGDLDDVEFTVFFSLKIRRQVDTEWVWVDTTTLIADDAAIAVRGRTCRARVQLWRSQRSPNRGGLAVLCRSSTGKAA